MRRSALLTTDALGLRRRRLHLLAANLRLVNVGAWNWGWRLESKVELRVVSGIEDGMVARNGGDSKVQGDPEME